MKRLALIALVLLLVGGTRFIPQQPRHSEELYTYRNAPVYDGFCALQSSAQHIAVWRACSDNRDTRYRWPRSATITHIGFRIRTAFPAGGGCIFNLDVNDALQYTTAALTSASGTWVEFVLPTPVTIAKGDITTVEALNGGGETCTDNVAWVAPAFYGTFQ